MAGYTYNLNNPPEYSQTPSADSVNGERGTNTTAARQNQRSIGSQSRGGSGDAYQMFRDAPMSWPTAASKNLSQPAATPLANILSGNAPQPASPQTFTSHGLAATLGAGQSVPGQPSAPRGGGVDWSFWDANFNIPPVPQFTPQPTSPSDDNKGGGTPGTQLPGGGVDMPSGGSPPQGDMPTGTGAPRKRPVSPVNPQAPLTDEQLSAAYKGGSNSMTPQIKALIDARNPKPQGTEDAAKFAEWMHGFAFLDPSFANVTEADVSNHRAMAVSGQLQGEMTDFGRWWLAGHQGQFTPGTPTTTTPPPNTGPTPSAWTETPTPQMWNGTRFSLDQLKQLSPEQLTQMLTPEQLAQFRKDTQQVATTPPSGAPSATPSAAPSAPPATTPTPPASTPSVRGESQSPIDVASVMRDLYDPLFHQQQSELARVLRAQAAFQDPNLPSSGGFQESLGRAESNLVNQQGAKLGEYTNQALDRAQQLAIAQMDDATKRFGIQTNDDLQRWLNSADSNTIQKLGIDKNDLLQRYMKELELQGVKYSADKGVDAAALHAAAAQAAANASSSATMAEIAAKQQMFGEQNKLDWAQLQANLYTSGQQNYVTELGFLMNSGLSANDALAILGIFGGSTPVFVNP